MSLTLCPLNELDPHDSARGDTTLLRSRACLVAHKCARVGPSNNICSSLSMSACMNTPGMSHAPTSCQLVDLLIQVKPLFQQYVTQW
jgi:hypothetical protein